MQQNQLHSEFRKRINRFDILMCVTDLYICARVYFEMRVVADNVTNIVYT